MSNVFKFPLENKKYLLEDADIICLSNRKYKMSNDNQRNCVLAFSKTLEFIFTQEDNLAKEILIDCTLSELENYIKDYLEEL